MNAPDTAALLMVMGHTEQAKRILGRTNPAPVTVSEGPDLEAQQHVEKRKERK